MQAVGENAVLRHRRNDFQEGNNDEHHQHNNHNNEPQQHRPSSACCIVTLHGMILDLTGWKDHPGGQDLLQRYHGRDATQAFEAAGHSDAARSLLVGFLDQDNNNYYNQQQAAANFVSQPTKIFLFLSLLAWFHHRPSIQLSNHHHDASPCPTTTTTRALPSVQMENLHNSKMQQQQQQQMQHSASKLANEKYTSWDSLEKNRQGQEQDRVLLALLTQEDPPGPN